MNCVSLLARRTALRLWRRKVSSSNNPKRTSYEADGKTTVTVLNKELSLGLMVDSYSQVGFRLNNEMMIIGPVALFPRSALSWNIEGPKDVTLESLELFFRLDPKLDLLVLGMGDSGTSIDPRLVVECRKRGLNLEVLATEQACATFNFLNAESRSVAAALIPPDMIKVTEDDVARTKFKNNRLIDPEYA